MSETVKDQETSSEQGNAGRRRLVRGAMALAPVVLTLRSGALAAASCTGAKVVSVTLDGNGSDPQSPSRIDNGDYCVPNLKACETPGKVETPPLSPPISNFQVASGKKCPAFANQNVAILSSTSAHSFIRP